MDAVVVSTASRDDVAVSLIKLVPTLFEGRRVPVVFVVVVSVGGAGPLKSTAHPRSSMDPIEAGAVFQAACDFWRVSP